MDLFLSKSWAFRRERENRGTTLRERSYLVHLISNTWIDQFHAYNHLSSPFHLFSRDKLCNLFKNTSARRRKIYWKGCIRSNIVILISQIESHGFSGLTLYFYLPIFASFAALIWNMTEHPKSRGPEMPFSHLLPPLARVGQRLLLSYRYLLEFVD